MSYLDDHPYSTYHSTMESILKGGRRRDIFKNRHFMYISLTVAFILYFFYAYSFFVFFFNTHRFYYISRLFKNSFELYSNFYDVNTV